MNDIEITKRHCLERVTIMEIKLKHVQLTDYREIFAIEGSLRELRAMLQLLDDLEEVL